MQNKKSSRVNFKIELNQEQKEAKALILDRPVSILTGEAGSGKTQLAVLVAMDLFFRKDEHYDKVIVTRPAESKEKLGFLPGDLKEKVEPYLAPIKECMYDGYAGTNTNRREEIDKYFENDTWRIIPIAFTRGVTYKSAIAIVDEFQNLTLQDFEMIIGRLGKDSKLIFTGSKSQIDLRNPEESVIHHIEKLSDNKFVNLIDLKTNHRHESIDSIFSDLRV